MYEIHIKQFEGPMDLLLHLVQQNELNPAEISIAQIADQYLAYLNQLSRADLSSAGDFLLLASQLMSLKTRELLPKEERDELEQLEFEADYEALRKQLQEYQQFKESAGFLQKQETENVASFYRGRIEAPRKVTQEELQEESGIYQLHKAFLNSLKTLVKNSVHTIEVDDVTIEDRQQAVENHLRVHGKAMFDDLLGRDRRQITAVVTFMAVLEMIKLDQIVLRQATPLGALWIYRKKDNAEFAREISSSFTPLSPDSTLKMGLAKELKDRSLLRSKVMGLHDILREVSTRVNEQKVVKDSHLEQLLNGKLPDDVFSQEEEEVEEELEEESFVDENDNEDMIDDEEIQTIED